MKKSTIILVTMLTASVIAVVFGFYILRQRSIEPLLNQQADSGQEPTTEQENDEEAPDSATSLLVGWKTYNNEKHGFSLLYPPALKVGSVSTNSVLGTFQSPVRGFHVGPLVLVVLKDPELKKQAQDYFNESYNLALNPVSSAEGPLAECKIDKVSNPNVVEIKSVSCTGEGGAGRYAYITGKTYDMFVDGYSKGFDNSDNGNFPASGDYAKLLGSFTFEKTDTTVQSDPQKTDTTGAIKIFSINANEQSAIPNEIAVPVDAIVQITFNVGTEVSSGGIDFKSSVVNSGTISPGQSKTISFVAKQSFEFTPLLSSDNMAAYKIKVTVN